jgi:transcriptional regulator with PAS, ATPase and Fis domain
MPTIREIIYPHEYVSDYAKFNELLRLYKADRYSELIEVGSIDLNFHFDGSSNVDVEDARMVVRIISEALFQAGMNTECLGHIEHAQVHEFLPLGDPHATIIRGWVYAKIGDYERSLQVAIEMLRDSRYKKETIYCGHALFLRGRSEYFLGRISHARRNLSDAIALFRISNSKYSQAAALNALGNLEKATCSLNRAVPIWEKSLAIFKSIECGQQIFSVIINLCVAYLKMGLTDKAQEYLDMDYSIVNDQQRIHKAIIESRIHSFKGEYKLALKVLYPFIETASKAILHRDECLLLESIGDAHLELNQFPSAQLYFERAHKIALSLPARGELIVGIELRKARLLAAEGENITAIKAYIKALRLSVKCKEKYEEAMILHWLGIAYCQTRQYRKAYDCLRKAVLIFREQGASYYTMHSLYEMAVLRYNWATEVRDIQKADPVAAVRAKRNDCEYLGSKDANHIQSAWSHVIEAYHGFVDLNCVSEQEKCETLMEKLKNDSHSIWFANPVQKRDSEVQVQNGIFISGAPSMQRLMTMIEVAAETNEPVLLVGETGTGKELVARLIHDQSSRANKSFVPVNCAAIPESLFESEFFGHTKGAFTGALFDKQGLCEEADKGTLFLDEIGDMPTLLQVKLLRLLQEGTFRRLGDPNERKVDLRILAATNAILPQMISTGSFRQDLYYRLQTLEIVVPPLRERIEDLDDFIQLFISKIIQNVESVSDVFENDILVTLRNYPWPGNVRELEAITRRLALMARHSGIATIDMLPHEISRWRDAHLTHDGGLHLAKYVDQAEKERILQALIITGGSRSDAAKSLGISRNSLYKKMNRLDIKLPV